MDVGISSGTGQYINYASGGAIPALDGTNVGFHWNGSDYVAAAGCTVNQPPSAGAGDDQTVECAGHVGTVVTLDGSGSSDPDGDALTYTWTGAFGTATGVSPSVALGEGSNTITLTVDDGNGGTDTDEVVVNVVDTTPPTLSLTISPNSLWPPNHLMVPVGVISASDICDAAVSLDIAVTSNEPENGTGDGDTGPDWEIVDNGDGTATVAVRAERKGNGTGRIYTISVTATDDSGNSSTTQSGTVTVPHSQKKK